MMSFKTERDGAGRIARIYRSLEQKDQYTLLSFAEFLAARSPPDQRGEVLEPESLARPAQETVVAAIKRLSRSYHMLDRSAMLNETSSLMAAHVLNGRAAVEVIDGLEALFQRHYAKYREEREA